MEVLLALLSHLSSIWVSIIKQPRPCWDPLWLTVCQPGGPGCILAALPPVQEHQRDHKLGDHRTCGILTTAHLIKRLSLVWIWFSAIVIILILYVCIQIYTFPSASTCINFVDPENSHVNWTHPGRIAILIVILIYFFSAPDHHNSWERYTSPQNTSLRKQVLSFAFKGTENNRSPSHKLTPGSGESLDIYYSVSTLSPAVETVHLFTEKETEVPRGSVVR